MTGPTARTMVQNAGLLLGIAVLATALMTEPPAGLSPAARQVAGVTLLVLWTELNSNVATAATFMPILAAIAADTDYPVLQLVAPAAIAASCGFMMPVGTRPNAVVFSTGRVSMCDLMRAGWRLNLTGIVVIAGVSSLTLPLAA